MMQYKCLGSAFLMTAVFMAFTGCGDAGEAEMHEVSLASQRQHSVQSSSDHVAPDVLADSLARKRCTWLVDQYTSLQECETAMRDEMLSEFAAARCVVIGENFSAPAARQCELAFEQARELWSTGQLLRFAVKLTSAKHDCSNEELCSEPSGSKDAI